MPLPTAKGLARDQRQTQPERPHLGDWVLRGPTRHLASCRERSLMGRGCVQQLHLDELLKYHENIT
jgi:hypothetical protein